VGLQILPLKLPAVHIAACLVTVKGRTLNPPATLFVDCVREMVRPLAKRKRMKVTIRDAPVGGI
jgi:hypothetical protein